MTAIGGAARAGTSAPDSDVGFLEGADASAIMNSPGNRVVVGMERQELDGSGEPRVL